MITLVHQPLGTQVIRGKLHRGLRVSLQGDSLLWVRGVTYQLGPEFEGDLWVARGPRNPDASLEIWFRSLPCIVAKVEDRDGHLSTLYLGVDCSCTQEVQAAATAASRSG